MKKEELKAESAKIVERIKLMIEAEDSNINAMGVVLTGTKTPTKFRNTIDGVTQIVSPDIIISIGKNYPQYNMNWLIKGEGEMLVKENVKLAALLMEENERLNEQLKAKNAELQMMQTVIQAYSAINESPTKVELNK